MDVLSTITLAGPQAQAERVRLVANGKEVNLVCRRRDARGVDVSRILYFGRSGECAWVVSQGLKAPDDIGIEIAFPDQARDLFAGYIERVMLMRQLVDPSPLSPEMVDLNPDIDALVEDLKAEFDVGIDPWA